MKPLKPLGVILTVMRWNKPAWWFFNIALFLYQLVMLSAGKLIGIIIISIEALWDIACLTLIGYIVDPENNWPIFKRFEEFVDTSWAEIFRAAQICHVRVKLTGDDAFSITAPNAKIETFWSEELVKNSKGHFIYREPVFEVTDDMVERGIGYAWSLAGSLLSRGYDYLQLLGYLVNLPIWLLYWPCFGKQVIPWFNLPGGREVCSSGGCALFRYAVGGLLCFAGFSNAMFCPALFYISKKWKKV